MGYLCFYTLEILFHLHDFCLRLARCTLRLILLRLEQITCLADFVRLCRGSAILCRGFGYDDWLRLVGLLRLWSWHSWLFLRSLLLFLGLA